MPFEQSPQAVLFDFDGVIIETEWVIYKTWKDLFAEHGQNLALETYVQCIGSDFETWSPETYLEDLTGKTFDWPAINAKRQIEIEDSVEQEEATKGFHELLTFLESKNILRAVVSSSSHSWVDRWLKRIDVFERFQEVVCRGDAPKIKPAPDLYLEAAKRLNVEPSSCLVLEDSKNGVLSAKEAGMQVIAIPSQVTQCIDFSIADRVEKSLDAVIDLFG